jgi:hypothetical protein
MAMDTQSVDVSPGSGRATYRARDLPMPDYHDLVSAISGVPPVPGIVSFNVEWGKSKDKHDYRYAPHQWMGDFVTTSATCTWSGLTAAAEFHTNTNNPTIFAEVGHEKSGVFFG